MANKQSGETPPAKGIYPAAEPLHESERMYPIYPAAEPLHESERCNPR